MFTIYNEEVHLKMQTILKERQEVTMDSLLAAVLDFANQDLLKERMKNNIPEMH